MPCGNSKLQIEITGVSYYCTEARAASIIGARLHEGWDKKNSIDDGNLAPLKERGYHMKVISKTGRMMSAPLELNKRVSEYLIFGLTCRHYDEFSQTHPTLLTCSIQYRGALETWLFEGDRFTRVSLFGSHRGDLDISPTYLSPLAKIMLPKQFVQDTIQ